jgi:hypothetical protein
VESVVDNDAVALLLGGGAHVEELIADFCV